MAQKFSDMNEVDFEFFLERLVDAIETHLGEPQNPDDMLDEGREIYSFYKEKDDEALFNDLDGGREDSREDKAFKILVEALPIMKRFVKDFGGEKWMVALGVPSRMPRTRTKVRETARAILSAWDSNSADPELSDIMVAADRLRTAFDDFMTAFEAQEDYHAKVASAYRMKREIRARAEKYIRRVKTYLSLYLDPYDYRWEFYGYEIRKRRTKKVEEEE